MTGEVVMGIHACIAQLVRDGLSKVTTTAPAKRESWSRDTTRRPLATAGATRRAGLSAGTTTGAP